MKEHTSQGLSQRLHDKGFRGEHTHYYAGKHNTLMQEGVDYSHGFEKIPAYTFTELWGVLPAFINADDKLEIWKRTNMWDYDETFAIAGYMAYGREVTWRMKFKHESPAEAVGLLLEWLIDNNHMEVKG